MQILLITRAQFDDQRPPRKWGDKASIVKVCIAKGVSRKETARGSPWCCR
jgi:hypothetical protein